jgi:DNA-binding CsgD family transcriptional regulator
MTAMAATEDSTDASDESSFTKIYVVGPNLQQNKLLALCLEKELKAECECRKFLPLSAIAGKDRKRQVLYLYDCLECNSAEMEKGFDLGTAAPPGTVMTMLFNVAADCRVEQVVKQNKVRAVFYQDDSRETFLKGIRAVLEGELWLTRRVLSNCILNPQLAASPAALAAAGLLSRREKMVLQQVAMGLSNKEIADRLNISLHTVKTHLYKIYHKIDVPNRLQATLWAVTYLTE